MDIKQIFENNQNWIIKQLKMDEEYFDKLGKGQSPEFLYIGCSDSRVSAEELMGLEPGRVFVHRNIANMIPNTDLNSMSVINYAVDHLKVKYIVVCGHYGCGGVHAAMQQSDLGILNPWLRNIRDVYRIHQKTLDKITDEDEKYKKLVELNVQEQCVNVIKTAEVQRAIRKRNLKVYGWIFDIHTGKLVDLNINFTEILKDITKIYKITD
ncbi:carbonic anhydrase [Flavobacterium gilvum]|uniref:Carbonic anhydrase 2 n=1 Tax=Flavobacterium gilvum TaxID=1492737 RepID=A0AAC9N4P6_9FLAO|nr:carbonic anhydrase [Flavobacterium gilvum]AOW11050.1 carbonic anhydrase [Flavobacterium gilvum]KFC57995.1 carbonate dehydratase [Flavobacterium gilvum]